MNNYIFYVEPKELLTVKETARFLTVSVSTVYKLIQSGKLNALMLGTRYKIEASELKRYVNSLESTK